jgi:CheY-like chemotaxis protein
MIPASSPYGLANSLRKAVSTPLRVLIVEDESLVALDLQERLILLGYEVAAVVDNGTDALLYARALKFDLVLMDIHIRGEADGIQTALPCAKRWTFPSSF